MEWPYEWNPTARLELATEDSGKLSRIWDGTANICCKKICQSELVLAQNTCH